jgi:hypothetical protein
LVERLLLLEGLEDPVAVEVIMVVLVERQLRVVVVAELATAIRVVAGVP